MCMTMRGVPEKERENEMDKVSNRTGMAGVDARGLEHGL